MARATSVGSKRGGFGQSTTIKTAATVPVRLCHASSQISMAARPHSVSNARNLEAAIDESFFVEETVGRKEELAVHVPDHGLIGPSTQSHIERAIIESVVPHLVKPNAHIEWPRCSNSCGVLRLKIASKRAGCHRDVAHAAFDEVSGERGFSEDGDVRARLEGVYLRKDPGEPLEVGGVVAFSRLELNYDEMNRAIHPSEVAMTQRYNQPLRALVLAVLLLAPASASAQQPDGSRYGALDDRAGATSVTGSRARRLAHWRDWQGDSHQRIDQITPRVPAVTHSWLSRIIASTSTTESTSSG